MIKLTSEEYNLMAKNRGIKEPQNMSTKKLLNKLNRHDNKCTHKKISRTGLEKITESQNISEIELNQVTKLKKKKKKING